MTQNRTNARILVVDDDRLVRSALKRAFLAEGWQVECASTGREALDLIAGDSSFNVVVADYFMPHINGLEFLSQVNRSYPHIYCVMLTAYPYCTAIKHRLNKTTHAVLLDKPWDERLLHTITDALEVQRQAGEARLA